MCLTQIVSKSYYLHMLSLRRPRATLLFFKFLHFLFAEMLSFLIIWAFFFSLFADFRQKKNSGKKKNN